MITCPYCGREIRDAHIHKPTDFPARLKIRNEKQEIVKEKLIPEPWMVEQHHAVRVLLVRDWSRDD